MKRLYLLRHAHTEPAAAPKMTDHERVLSEPGTRAAAALGDYMREKALLPDFILSSSSVRTVQTARIVFDKLPKNEGQKIESRFDRKLYLAPADTLLSEIRGTDDDFQSLLVVGHSPGIAELALALSGKSLADHTQDYAPGTLAVFDADIGSWHDANPASMKLTQVFAPKD